jgi:peptidyl-prolyl cis-trans isomerase B (cyclophilin B)
VPGGGTQHPLTRATDPARNPHLKYDDPSRSQHKGNTGPMKVRLQTSYGAIIIELDPHKAPKTVNNFIAYVRDGFFDGTLVHRVIDDFMLQGGGFQPGMMQKPTRPPIENEAKNGLRNERGAIAMARTTDPHSATSQFFINVVDNDFLNYTAETPSGWGYCVFGKVVDGMTVIDRIKGVPTGSKGGHKNVPLSDVIIEKIEVLEG